MKWNASLSAASSLLLIAWPATAAPVLAPPVPSARMPTSGVQDRPDSAAETWRAADGSIRTRAPAPQAPALVPEAMVEPDPPRAHEPVRERMAEQQAGTSYAEPTRDTPHADVRTRAALSAPATPESRAPQDLSDPTIGMEGPRGTSQPGAGEVRYDEIGRAGIADTGNGVSATHRSLPPNSYVEVTALDTGRTILVRIADTVPGADHPIDLSADAARQLGLQGEDAPVRIRRVAPSPQDVALLRAGQPAQLRADAPPVLLTALRRRLPGTLAAPLPPVRPSTASASGPQRPLRATPAPPRVPVRGGFVVQVAALSHASNAQALAKSMGGFVKQGGRLHRVQLGPFATRAEAETARAGAARAGHTDARVITAN